MSSHGVNRRATCPARQTSTSTGWIVVTRLIALFLAVFFLALAFIGIALPGVPTVPFLLLAAWFSAKGSERLHRWLYAHPLFGKLLIDWETNRAVSRKSKVIAVVMLSISWGLMYPHFNAWAMAGMSLLFIAIALFLATRPEPREPPS